MRRALLPLACTLLCCAPADPHAYCATQPQCIEREPEYVCLDSALPAEAVQAVRMWAGVLCDVQRFAILPIDGGVPIPAQCRYTVLAVLSSYPWVQQRPEHSVAFADPARGLAWIVVDVVPPGLLRAAVAHELGALLGATDDLGPGVMGSPLRDDCIAQHSVDEVKGIRP